ncbi:type II toxin-antitoxin system RelE/ParE family toxin [Candidatus Acetothermia bacterium]|nr:type II toxin-antitoxin system RelE/ParE family toxin [Candidatus Acetothermia bacterium]
MEKLHSKNLRNNTEYNLILIPPAREDFDGLTKTLRQQAVKQFEKLKRYPEAGTTCGNQQGLNLAGFYSLHFHKNTYRIVYEIIKDEKKVKVWGIGKRDRSEIYKMVATRLGNIYLELSADMLRVSGTAKVKRS